MTNSLAYMTAKLKVTPAFTKAFLAFFLPIISDFCSKSGLPVPTPVTEAHVRKVKFSTIQPFGSAIYLDSGWNFITTDGAIDSFDNPYQSWMLRPLPPDHPEPMSRDEAITMCRKFLVDLGYDLEALYADLEPNFKPDVRLGSGKYRWYRITWVKPQYLERDTPSVEFLIDAINRRIVHGFFLNRNLDKPLPKLAVEPEYEYPAPPPVEADNTVKGEAKQSILLKSLASASDYIPKLHLPISTPLYTNDVKWLKAETNSAGEYFIYLTLKSGWQFNLGNECKMVGFYSPSNFFNWRREVRLKDYVGSPKLSKTECAKRIRDQVIALGNNPRDFAMNHQPEIIGPAGNGVKVPRYLISWYKNLKFGRLQTVSAEIDAATGNLASLIINPDKE